MACTWLGEISTCSCLTALPGPAWVLLSKICKPFAGSLYKMMAAYFMDEYISKKTEFNWIIKINPQEVIMWTTLIE